MNNYVPEIDAVTESFVSAFGSLTNDELNRRLTPESWSIAQIIEHLIIINKSYFPVIESARNGTLKLPIIARIDLVVNFFGKMILKSVQPGSKKKMKTFPIWQPAYSSIPGGILQRFEKHQSELKNLIYESEELLGVKAVIHSPANKHIVYTLESAFDIIIAHEKRHLIQAKEVMQILMQD
jgi:hypothetical protein